jgi:signal transduction histidine kinase
MAKSRRPDAVTVWIGPEWADTRRRVRSLIALAAVTYSVAVSRPPGAGFSGRPLAVTALLAVASLTWLYVIFLPPRRRVEADVALVVVGVAGVALTFVSPHSAAVVFVAVAIARSTRSWLPEWSVALGVALAIAYVIGHLAINDTAIWLLTGPVAVALSLLAGSIRRQNDMLTTEVQIAREEHARSAALDERARIAREIHDVLAHSLAALAVQLETADALIERGRSAQAHASVKRAGQLAKEGLAETRRAIGALRGDTLPLPELLTTLASGYELDTGATATVDVTGEPRTLRPDVSLTLYRTAQEAITNVRKHAPGALVDVFLAYRPDEVALTVASGAARDGARPLADAGGGYGLTGLRERAELAGGTFDAGPDGIGWRVDVRIPW